MVNGSWMNATELADNAKRKRQVGWCVNQVHDCIGRIRRVWRWAERKKLVPSNAYSHLLTLPPIGRAEDVRRTTRRRAADESSVQAVLSHLTPMVSAMLQLQSLTGMRPGELVKMRVSQIDTSGELWLYVMDRHKTEHLDGQDSTVVLGPESQLILFPYLEAAKRCGNDPIWTPRPSSSAHYTSTGYYRAIARACARMGVKHFTPYQIRHLCKRRVTQEHGLDAARAVLRQRSLATTDGYDRGVDIETAKQVASKMG
jgi:integrase